MVPDRKRVGRQLLTLLFCREMMMGHDVRVGNTSTTVWVARMVMEKERLEGAEAAGGVVRQSEICVLAPCMIKIQP